MSKENINIDKLFRKVSKEGIELGYKLIELSVKDLSDTEKEVAIIELNRLNMEMKKNIKEMEEEE